jgi:protein-S-isoprenylcysteine O-methyltransferase
MESPTSSASSLDMDLQSDSPTVSWPLNRPAANGADWTPPKRVAPSFQTPRPLPPVDPSNWPNGSRSLAGISLRSFLLGIALGITTPITLYLLLVEGNILWRLPFFLASLALFHFLEYYITAAYNTPYASISAFLLSQNGSAYNIAHSAAMLECLVSRLFAPSTYFNLTSKLLGGPVFAEKYLVPLGLTMMAIGQTTRSLAMVTAAGNFNHTVQVRRREGHELVTNGIYAWLRHPSYFGFFWWGLGTQVVLGNRICLAGYALVLWRFFKSRIQSECPLFSSTCRS